MKHLSKFAALLVTGAFVCLAFTGCPHVATESTTPVKPTYTVTISDGIENGTVTASKTNGITAGETITLTVTPENGEENVTVTSNAFTMPNANVTVSATFKLIYIGSKAPSAAKALGDIVFTDGSATPYTEFTEENSMTDDQKNAAVAVIFDAENKLGVGLNMLYMIWCKYDATAFNTDEYAKSLDDGKANTDEIAGLSDYSEDKYPAFYFCTSYSEGNFTSGWYLPAKSELQKLYDNREAVGNAFTALGKTNPFTVNTYYHSSSQYDNTNNIYTGYTYAFNFFTCDWCHSSKTNCLRVCAVRAF